MADREPMHPAYFETRFRTNEPIEDWPEEFVIVSACATTGETWTAEQDAEADRNLKETLEGMPIWHRRITGYSPETGHSERSWAIHASAAIGCHLGRCFKQDAIFHVVRDELFVVRCDDESDQEPVGEFRERLDHPHQEVREL